MAFKREVAARIFAQEFRESDLFFKEDDSDKAPGFLITPTGAKANRVMIVGTMTEKENKAEDGSPDFWQIRVSDPTGQHYIYSGQYQPEVSASIAEIEPPRFVSIIAKTGVYDGGEEGGRFSRLRPESIRVVDAETRNRWILETAKLTTDRIAGCAEVLRRMGIDGGFTSADDLDDLSELIDVEPIKQAIGYYGIEKEDLRKRRDMVALALRSLTGDKVEDDAPKYGKIDCSEKPQDVYIAGSDGRKKRMPTIEEVEF